MRKTTQHYDRQRRKGRIYSALLHVLFILFAIFGLPSLLSDRPPPEPMALTVDLVKVSELSNIQPSSQTPAEKPRETPKPKAPEPKEAPKPAEQKNAKETPPVKTETPPPTPPPPEEKPAPPKPKPEPPKPKPEKPKPKPKPKKPQADPLDAILKSVAKEAKNEPEKAPDKPEQDEGGLKRTLSSRFDPSQQISLSVKDAIRSQIAHCWSVPAGVKDAQHLVVTLRIQVAQDGSVTRVELAQDRGRYDADNVFRAAADSAMRAVHECSPLKDLPAEKYQGWRDMELTFDPKDMLF